MADAVKFGKALQRFREDRTLSLRELATLSAVDHAYIHRLESGDKTAPSADVLDKLTRGLKLPPARRKLLDLLCDIEAMHAALFELALKHPERIEAIKSTAKMSFRGERPETEEEWDRKVRQVEEILGHAPG